ncbi:pyridoxamine 5'-phosphate oxidase family protein [Fodinicurvata sp. EGI_FJ10296]|uniref:pyridoxamine 5'-phosphate oxidase family protein n=1 Tax=Fodinicurvata sp. EGI_FJ10296 TaxID=3231908 RepID=UPI00345449C7
MASQSHCIDDIETLESVYGAPSRPSITKEVDYVHAHYRAMIQASPFAALATIGPDGLDVSPRGDGAGFVVVEDEKTLLLPDRPGNNRVDSLRNIVHDPRMALLFMIPGVSETLRVNGRATLSLDPALLTRFAVKGKAPRSIMIVAVETVFFQCARALVRSGLWSPENHVDRASLPSTGTLLADIGGEVDAGDYDRRQPERVKDSLY